MQEHVEELISSYIDGEVTDDERQLIETHLKNCNQCQVLMEEMVTMKNNVFLVYEFIEIPQSLEENVLAVIGTDKTAKDTLRIKMSWFVFAFFIALTLLIVLALSPIGIFIVSLSSSVFNIMFSLLRVIPILISSVPQLLVGISVFIVVLFITSTWFLRRLLFVQKVT